MHKLLLLSDLHFGKKLKNYDLREEISHSLSQVYDYLDKTSVDGVVVAGVMSLTNQSPHTKHCVLLSNSPEKLTLKEVKLYIIAGNHDDIKRLAQRSDYLEKRIYS